MKTALIKYNVLERGRKYIGQPRNFNASRIAQVINSPKTQELVESGDMVGYLGHGTREEFGLLPSEVGFKNGKMVSIDPAFKTTYLKAYEDGTIEHMAEFADNDLGRAAYSWYCSKLGGFSSVVVPNEQNPIGFLGFDYVRMPNFNGNRGYVMDSADIAFDFERLTSRQSSLLMQERMIERQVILDSVVSKHQQLQERVDAGDMIQAQLLNDLESVTAKYDEAKWDLQNAKFELEQAQIAYEPMMRLSVSPSDNWLAQTAVAMDSLDSREFLVATERDRRRVASDLPFVPVLDHIIK
ncbi:hypothetical protein AB8Q18_08335 [Neisseriaceae bacterium CLB008]